MAYLTAIPKASILADKNVKIRKIISAIEKISKIVEKVKITRLNLLWNDLNETGIYINLLMSEKINFTSSKPAQITWLMTRLLWFNRLKNVFLQTHQFLSENFHQNLSKISKFLDGMKTWCSLLFFKIPILKSFQRFEARKASRSSVNTL